MTEVKSYKCDICGKLYETKEAATFCENYGHTRPQKIICCDYLEGQISPRFLTVQMENGVNYEYKRVTE